MKQYILLKNLGSKHNLVINLITLKKIAKEKFLPKNSSKYVALKLVPGPLFSKNPL